MNVNEKLFLYFLHFCIFTINNLLGYFTLNECCVIYKSQQTRRFLLKCYVFFIIASFSFTEKLVPVCVKLFLFLLKMQFVINFFSPLHRRL